MGQSWSFSSGEYTKGKNGVTGKAIRHGAFEIQELKGEGLIETEGGGKEKYLSDNGKYEEVDAIKSLSISGRTITYTKRDGTQGSLVTQDTNTDTHYTARLYIGGNTGGSNAPTSNGGTYLKLYENGTVRDAKLIKGTGKTKVSSDSLGNVTVDTSVNEITEINADYIRITDLSTGIYKLRYYNLTWKELLSTFHKYMGCPDKKIWTIPDRLFAFVGGWLKKKQKKKGIEGGLDLKKLWKIQCAEAIIDKSLGCELLGVEPDDIFAAIGESVKLCMDILENKTAEVVEMKGE